MVIEWWRILRAFYCLTFFSEAKIKTQNQHKRIEMGKTPIMINIAYIILLIF